jgi:hypothetical protein
MGEESITFPFFSTMAINTSRNGSSSCSEVPTSKVCQVPKPITGSISFEEGMGLFLIWFRGIRDNSVGKLIRPRPARGVFFRNDLLLTGIFILK